MLRGIITGLFFGGALGLLLVGVVSLLAPLPSNIAVPQAEEPTASQPTATSGTSLSGTSATDAPVQAESVAQSPAEIEGVDGAPNADRASAPRPDTVTVEGAPQAPAENGNLDVALQSETPVLPNPQAKPISKPGEDDEPSISVDPAQPQSPTNVEAQAFDAPKTDDSNAPVVATDLAPTQVAPEQQGQAGDDALPSVDVATPEPLEVPSATDTPEPEQTASLLKPATGFGETFEQKTSTRLPTVGDTEVATEVAQGAAQDVTQAALPPLEAFAAKFEPEGDKPLMSIVLLDDESAGVTLETLADFPLPVSIAVNAQSANAVSRSAALRAAGLEVLAVMDFPAGALPSDVAINIEGQLANVPEAIAVMDGFSGGIQENREVADQVIDYMLASGHGLVLQPKGLNTAQKLAAREGVGAVSVFRDFDGKGQTEVVMRRFLDQAAFKARQKESVLMMGRLQENTIAALASWALQDRASTVSVAPVSALLMSIQNEN